MTDVFDELAERQAQRAKAADAAFWKTARDLAAGKKPKADAVHEVLDAAGKTIADLKTAVATHAERLALFEKVEAFPALDAKRPALAEAIDAEADKLRAARDAHDAAVAPLHEQIAQIDAARHQAETAREKLLNGCPYPDLVARFRAVESEQQAAKNQRFQVGRNLAELRAKLEATKAEPVTMHFGVSVTDAAAERKTRAGILEGAIAETEAAAKALDEKIAALEPERAELAEKVLKP